MKQRIMNRLAAWALALLLATSLAVPAMAADESAQAAAQAATHAMQYGMADSVQYALWEEGEITLSGHAGTYSRTENRALQDTDLYGIGSVSKIYTTVAVLRLVQEGKVSLDAPVTRYLPSFRMADDRYRQITVRMLLNHSSGLMGTTQVNAFLFDDTDRTATEDLLERLSTQRLKAEPGAYSVYCNDGFTLAELVVEAVSGESFPDYVRKVILEPNDLQNTFAPQDTFDPARLAKTYLNVESKRPLAQECLGIVGAGGLYANAADLAALGGLLTGDTLLNAASRTAMANPEYDRGIWPEDTEDLLSYGLGWDSVEWFPFSQNNIQALVKGGDTTSYHSGLVVLPGYQMAAAVVTSGGVSTYNELAATRILIDALERKGIQVDETVPELPAAKPATLPSELMESAGYYASTMQQMEIKLSADGVMTMHSLTVPSAPDQVLQYYDDGSFRNVPQTMLMRLVKEENGETYLYQKAYTPIPELSAMASSNYLAQRVEAGQPGPEAQAAWDEFATNGWLLVSEKASSQTWPLALASVSELPEYIPGYMGTARIVDEKRAQYGLQIPGVAGRDGQDLAVETRDGVVCYVVGGLVFAESSIARNLYSGENAYTTIQPNGFARWYTIGGSAGTTMRVDVPKGGGFTVYDAGGNATASSAAWGDTSAVLPAGGYVAFAGDPGMRFHLTFVK